MNISKPEDENMLVNDITEVIDEILSVQQRKLKVENIEVVRKYSPVPIFTTKGGLKQDDLD